MQGVRCQLPAALGAALDHQIERWARERGTERLWSRDASLWTNGDEADWLGWLDLAEAPAASRQEIEDLVGSLAGELDAVVLLGMGGSSLGGAALYETLAPRPPEGPELFVLDTTDPDAIQAVDAALAGKAKDGLGPDVLVLVASKSGGTLETALLGEHFYAGACETRGSELAGPAFVAITDPGSKLERQAQERGYRAVLPGLPSVGGRFSVLSVFGLAPAALTGVDLGRLLSPAADMAAACREAEPEGNPGAWMGLLLAAAAELGRDKLTVVTEPGLEALGPWIEQLVAESTGKGGRGILPLAGERLGPPEVYGEDRLFVHLLRAGGALDAQERRLDRLAAAGHPVLHLELGGAWDLGGELFRWQVATAVAASRLGMHPFDQPDVESAKVVTRDLIAALGGDAKPGRTGGTALAEMSEASLCRALEELFAQLEPGGYFALLPYLHGQHRTDEALESLRHVVRDRLRIATSLGYGPRYLHSTGQLFKGGPPGGAFLVLTAAPRADLPVPGAGYTFGQVERAQAEGDASVLRERGLPLLHLDLGREREAAIERLVAAVRQVLGDDSGPV